MLNIRSMLAGCAHHGRWQCMQFNSEAIKMNAVFLINPTHGAYGVPETRAGNGKFAKGCSNIRYVSDLVFPLTPEGRNARSLILKNSPHGQSDPASLSNQ